MTRAVERTVRALLTAVFLALALYGAWDLGSRFAGKQQLAAPERSRRLPSEARSPGVASRPPTAQPATGHLSASSPAAGEPPSAGPFIRGQVVAPDALPAPERGSLPMPVLGADALDLRDDFHDARGRAASHDAIDILAPRGTPVVAVDDGTIAKLFLSERGGLTIYHFDPTASYCYYYAHLEGYAPDLQEGQRVARGQVIGYVGTSGNAPKDRPHLHFSVNRLGAEKRWWETTPVNPFPLLRAGGSASGDSDPD